MKKQLKPFAKGGGSLLEFLTTNLMLCKRHRLRSLPSVKTETPISLMSADSLHYQGTGFIKMRSLVLRCRKEPSILVTITAVLLPLSVI